MATNNFFDVLTNSESGKDVEKEVNEDAVKDSLNKVFGRKKWMEKIGWK